jgi:pimeloyl-ACP methyl ester carboxylesterase
MAQKVYPTLSIITGVGCATRLGIILLLAIFCLAIPGLAGDNASHFAPFDGIKVHYESYGSGKEALVFIHGWTCDLTFWRGQAPVYSNRRSLLIDLPGHGESDKPKVAYPLEFFARGIEAVLRDAGVERAVLVGHSLGGPIAYSFIRLFPAQAKALVLVDATVYNTPSDASFQAAQQVQYRQRARTLSGSAGEKNFLAAVNAMFSARTPPSLRDQIRVKMLATPEYVRVAAVTSASEMGSPAPGATFDVPALAIQAAKNGTEQRAAAMRTIFPKLRLEKWTGSGHFLMMEDPARFNLSLEKFLSGL